MVRERRAVAAAGPELLTVGCDPCPLPYCGGSEAEAQKTEASNREQGDEHPLTGAEARAVSGSSLTAGDQAGQAGPGSCC